MKSCLRFFNIAFLITILLIADNCIAGEVSIKNDPVNKTVQFGNNKMKITLDYNKKCNISRLEINNEVVISGAAGIFSQIKTAKENYSTLNLSESPNVKIKKGEVEVNGIKYGENEAAIKENWKFIITDSDIKFNVERTVPKSVVVEEASFPSFNFDNINTWEGAFLGNGGVAWFYLFNEKLCTYAVHTGYSAFWNSKTDNGLKISASSPGKQVAVKFSRSNEDKLVYNVTVSDKEMVLRYDEDTHRRRFTRGKTDAWSAFKISAGKYGQSITLTPFNYKSEYNRGNFKGIDGNKITSVLNTIARIGVIDSKLYGGNSWHTPYGPICLHEQYIAQFGIALNDSNYINGYKECLDYFRDNAIKPDGRVLPRWAYDNSDAMPGTATPLGFYEAQWGYLIDSNPDFVSNVSQLYNLCGDIKWVGRQKSTCEKALDYLLKRDSNENHLVEVMTNSESENRGSDWIDIVWASFENAFVNAKLYYALTLWADVERQLGDKEKAAYYSDYAAELKKSFNKSTADGGFWDDNNKCYVHWLDKDKSVHGNNFVIPVNLMAITYGICDDDKRRALILDKLEDQMQKENLFIWPLCLYSYEKGELKDSQMPFPEYENGDIFLSWGAIGVEAYAGYKPELALKYVENILTQHSKDGLAFQRYGRNKQDGRGDDILSGNCLAVAGLYQGIYGINPLYNRLYLNPHITEKLSGTELNYNFRGDKLKINLNKNNYSITGRQFTVSASTDFGFYSSGNELSYFNNNSDKVSLKAKADRDKQVSIEIVKWNANEFSWKQSSAGAKGNITYTICNTQPNKVYTILANAEKTKSVKSSKTGSLTFTNKFNNEIKTLNIKIQ
ncbi:MAG: hypothetical protein P4L45_13435 [Ignavibacteriaceae bacterium]|nr:hypothetical protein [Ignavibacteriaceae bacterium]